MSGNSAPFMSQDPGPWTGVRLGTKLAEGLMPDNACLDLYVRTLWALLRRPVGNALVDGDKAFCGTLLTSGAAVFENEMLMPESRQELAESLGLARWAQPELSRGATGGR